jgi:hypothetical protein
MKNRIIKYSKHHGFWVFNFSILHSPSQKPCWIAVVSILLQLLSWASSYEGNQVGKWEKTISNLPTYAICAHVLVSYVNEKDINVPREQNKWCYSCSFIWFEFILCDICSSLAFCFWQRVYEKTSWTENWIILFSASIHGHWHLIGKHNTNSHGMHIPIWIWGVGRRYPLYIAPHYSMVVKLFVPPTLWLWRSIDLLRLRSSQLVVVVECWRY